MNKREKRQKSLEKEVLKYTYEQKAESLKESLKEIPEEYNCKSEPFAYKKNGGIKREYGR